MDHGDGWVVTADLIFAFVPGCTTFVHFSSVSFSFLSFGFSSSCSFPLPPLGSCFSSRFGNHSFLPSFLPNLFLTACHINFAPFSTLLPPSATCHLRPATCDLPPGHQQHISIFLAWSHSFTTRHIRIRPYINLIVIFSLSLSESSHYPPPRELNTIRRLLRRVRGCKELSSLPPFFWRIAAPGLSIPVWLVVLHPRIDIEPFHDTPKHDQAAQGRFSAVNGTNTFQHKAFSL
jgi:hypothetical protein